MNIFVKLFSESIDGENYLLNFTEFHWKLSLSNFCLFVYPLSQDPFFEWFWQLILSLSYYRNPIIESLFTPFWIFIMHFFRVRQCRIIVRVFESRDRGLKFWITCLLWFLLIVYNILCLYFQQFHQILECQCANHGKCQVLKFNIAFYILTVCWITCVFFKV